MIEKEIAAEFIKACAWWHNHPSGNPVRASKHSERIVQLEFCGWAIDFGSNTFLVEYAIELCVQQCKEHGNIYYNRRVLEEKLRTCLQQCVMNFRGDFYDLYPLDGNSMIFGTQSINV
jgi:hypothetical protein